MKSIFINLGYFFAGAGIVNAVTYNPLKSYLENSHTHLQIMVASQKLDHTQQEKSSKQYVIY
jgi:hypothetical protein